MTGCPGGARWGRSCEAWWCRLDSNQRQRDYESRALPPELRHRASRARLLRPQRRRSYLAVCARALSLRFLVRRLASATRFLLFTSSPGCCGATQGSVLGADGCGGRIRTDDLRVMSPTSCRCSTPLQKYTAGHGTRRPGVSGAATPKGKAMRVASPRARAPRSPGTGVPAVSSSR
jgi:hypothetical protein